MDKINRTFGVLKEKGIFSTRTLTVAILGIMIITLFWIVGNVGSGAVTPDYCFEFESGTITKYVGAYSNVVIPSKINGVPVTKIDSYAFNGCTRLTSITLPDSLTQIGFMAFNNCTSLTSITLPDSLTQMGNCTFNNCTSLTSVTLSNSQTQIGERAFEGCSSLTSITIPDSVTIIGSGAFQYCTGLTSITLPDSVTLICSSAFRGCTNLSTITNLRASTQAIESDSFENTCVGGIAYAYPSNTTFINRITAAGYTVKGFPPSINYTLSPSTLTNQDVKVTVSATASSGEIEQTKWARGKEGIDHFATGGTPFNGYFHVDNNGTYTIYARDTLGSESVKEFTITNIDKVKPVITINPYTTTPTNKDITVTATTNEGTLNATSHTFTANGSFTFIATDSAGNTTSKTVTITNIDKVAPVITILPYETRPTDKDIKVTATVNKGTLDVSEYIFTLNGSFTFRAEDVYGNTAEKTVTITNIYKDGVFDGFVFDGKTGTIVGYNGNETDITLPSVIKGVPVVSIGDYAFEGKGIESLVIPDSVEYIGKEAFANNDLGDVRIPNDTSFSPDSFNGNGAELVIVVTEETLAYDSAIKTSGINILVLPKPVVETLEITGNIEATVISITVPTSIEFVANQEDGSIISSNFELINNTNVDLGVSLCDFSLSKNSPHTFIDVLPDEKDWSKLGVLDSKTYISLGLKPLKTDGDGWVVCLVNQPIYVKEIDDMIELGTIRKKSGVSFEVVGNTGRAFIETVRVLYDLVFMFELR